MLQNDIVKGNAINYTISPNNKVLSATISHELAHIKWYGYPQGNAARVEKLPCFVSDFANVSWATLSATGKWVEYAEKGYSSHRNKGIRHRVEIQMARMSLSTRHRFGNYLKAKSL
jgi:hypothetical protein